MAPAVLGVGLDLVCWGLLLFLLTYPEALESNGTEKTRVSRDTVNLMVFCELSLTSMSSPLQLAEELQNKPLSSEMGELLKLLSKPNVKVRAPASSQKVLLWGLVIKALCACISTYMLLQIV